MFEILSTGLRYCLCRQLYASGYLIDNHRRLSSTIITMKLSVLTISFLLTGALAFVPTQKSGTAFAPLFSTVDDKTEVREYFNTEGFNRWNKIYSNSDDVNTVQLDIRTGHDQTIQKILNWIKADGNIQGKTVCDCGCGVGSLAIPLAQMGKFRYLSLIFRVVECFDRH